jgi:CheY-like chemotaxis protein
MTLPFYHPSTAVFVDDSADFLLNISLQLDPKLAFRLFSSPQAALEFIHHPLQHSSEPGAFFLPYHGHEDVASTHRILDVDFGRITERIHDAARFQQVSVVVVDYDMPAMNGLEFCRQLQATGIRKILLTGKADETIAIEAFNRGEIDRFIVKQRSDAVAQLNREIDFLQPAFFKDKEASISTAVAISPYQFLQDEIFVEALATEMKALGIVEYYLSAEPKGILMLDQEGSSWLLAVMSDEDLNAQYEIAEIEGAPLPMLAAMQNEVCLPYFGKAGSYYSSRCQDWRACIHPATAIKSKQNYRYAIIKAPAGFDLSEVLPYSQYLRRLDQAAINQSL